MQQTLKRILKIVEKTGDRVIVIDINTNQSFVVMDLHSYERLMENGEKNHHHVADSRNLEDDMDLWHKTQQELHNPSSEPMEMDPNEPMTPEDQPNIKDEEQVQLHLDKGQQVEPVDSGNRYYFEEIDDNKT